MVNRQEVADRTDLQEIALTDLIDVQVLQKIQNGFSKFTGMAALTTDAQGNPVTEGSGFTEFCFNLTRTTEKGLARCAECDRKGALLTLEQGEPVVYDCHAGLLDFAAPIMVEGTFIGSFIGGQICTAPLKESDVRRTAAELGIDQEAYIEAAAKVNVIEYEQVQRAAEFLSEIAEVLSEMAYSSYMALKQSRQLERVTRSHNLFIVDMNANMKQHVQDWIGTARGLKDTKLSEKANEILHRLMDKGEEFMATIDDTVEFSKIASGEIELDENEYDIRDMINSVRRSFLDAARAKGNEITVEFSRDLPEILLGDAGRINQIVSKFVRNAVLYTKDGHIAIRVSGVKKSYATNLVIRIEDTGRGMNPAELQLLQSYAHRDASENTGDRIGIAVIPMLVDKMSGSLEVESNSDEGTVIVITIPQLAVQMGRGM
ncbi:MAG: PocR ligand-binding domain-containing protein [Clostridium sp.]|nr:PocR ligand-binding domain-containing protein [Acetatifactor muris]MCM1527551.1 PocR ligand-binding domain-containing protein [Bacteroides sp.]MCM1563793.1 PocR ligand-binding domain-containing protein [Clostridium sp.]